MKRPFNVCRGIALAALIVACHTQSLRAADKVKAPEGVTLKAGPWFDFLGPYRPLSCVVVLQNKSKHTLRAYGRWTRSLVCRYKAVTGWREFDYHTGGSHATRITRLQLIYPGTMCRVLFLRSAVSPSGKAIFAPGGQYDVQFQVSLSIDGEDDEYWTVSTSPARIEVAKQDIDGLILGTAQAACKALLGGKKLVPLDTDPTPLVYYQDPALIGEYYETSKWDGASLFAMADYIERFPNIGYSSFLRRSYIILSKDGRLPGAKNIGEEKAAKVKETAQKYRKVLNEKGLTYLLLPTEADPNQKGTKMVPNPINR